MESLSGTSEDSELRRANNNNNNNNINNDQNNSNNNNNIAENNIIDESNNNNNNEEESLENGIAMNTIDISKPNNISTLDDQYNSNNKNNNKKVTSNSSTFKNKVDFSFKNINHYVSIVAKNEKGKKKKVSKQILTNINGHVNSGEMFAIMGPSGAGKTSLLDILAHRLPINGTGTIYLNGNKSNFQVFKKLCGYVTQHDSLTPSMTVRETLNFYAQLKMPRNSTIQEKLQRVQDVINEMGLKRCAETLVGTADNRIRGISGGERRRVTIAIELLTGPSILFLDEPTSGLDASTAYSVMYAIKKLARLGRTIICTIHQPRSNIYDMFDRLLLLGEGNVIYSGDSSKAIDYFNRYGYQCSNQTNPADFFMDLINLQVEDQVDSDEDEYDEEDNLEIYTPSSSTSPVLGVPKLHTPKRRKKLTTEEINILKKEYPESPEGIMISQTLDAIEKENRSDFKYEKIEGPTFFTQFKLLLHREILNAKRHPLAFKVQLFQAIFQGLLCGVVYYQLGLGQSSVQSRTGVLAFVIMGLAFPNVMGSVHVFPDVITIFLKDKAAGVYNTLPFFLAKSFIDVFNATILPILTGTIVYWMCNQRVYPFFAAAPFFRFLLVLVMTAQTALSLGVLISSSVPSVQVGMAVTPLIVILLFLFSGFFINLNDVPGWLVWFPYISFFKYIIESAVINGFQNVIFSCTNDQIGENQCQVFGDSVIKNMGFEIDHFWRNIWVLVLYIIGFRTITFLVLKFKSRDKFTQK